MIRDQPAEELGNVEIPFPHVTRLGDVIGEMNGEGPAEADSEKGTQRKADGQSLPEEPDTNKGGGYGQRRCHEEAGVLCRQWFPHNQGYEGTGPAEEHCLPAKRKLLQAEN